MFILYTVVFLCYISPSQVTMALVMERGLGSYNDNAASYAAFTPFVQLVHACSSSFLASHPYSFQSTKPTSKAISAMMIHSSLAEFISLNFSLNTLAIS